MERLGQEYFPLDDQHKIGSMFLNSFEKTDVIVPRRLEHALKLEARVADQAAADPVANANRRVQVGAVQKQPGVVTEFLQSGGDVIGERACIPPWTGQEYSQRLGAPGFARRSISRLPRVRVAGRGRAAASQS